MSQTPPPPQWGPNDQPQWQTNTSPPQWQPTNPPPPAPPAPTKERSWFARHKILTAFLAIVLLALLGKAIGGDTTGTSTVGSGETAEVTPAAGETSANAGTKATKSEAPKAPAGPRIGTKVRDGKFEFVITGVKEGGTQIGDSSFGEKAQGVFQLVDVTVTNIGDEPQTMFDSNQKVKDAQGREFSPNSMAAIQLDDDGNTIWLQEINPGNTVQGTLVYDMPKGSKPVSIELHYSMFSGGVEVSLR